MTRLTFLTHAGALLEPLPGQNVGRQLGDLNGLDDSEVDCVLSGIKSSLTGKEPEHPLATYVPKAVELLNAKKAKVAEAAAGAGLEALKAAGAEDGATTTASGLVILDEVEGSGPSPAASDTVEVHYEGKLVDGTVRDRLCFARTRVTLCATPPQRL